MFSSMTYTSGRPRMINGRIVRDQQYDPYGYSPNASTHDGGDRTTTTSSSSTSGKNISQIFLRIGIVAAVFGILYQNYINHQTDARVGGITHFGLFSVSASTKRGYEHGGFQINLFNTPTLAISFCPHGSTFSHTTTHEGMASCDFWIDQLCHQRPMMIDPRHYAYTTHRILCWIYVVAAIMTFCFPSFPHSFYSMIGSTRTLSTFFRYLLPPMPIIFISTHNYASPMGIMYHHGRKLMLWLMLVLFLESALLYPIWQVLEKTIEHQDQSSIFHLFSSSKSFVTITGQRNHYNMSKPGPVGNYILGVVMIWSMISFICHSFVYNNAAYNTIPRSRQQRRQNTLHLRTWLGYYVHSQHISIAVLLGYFRGAHGNNPNTFLFLFGYYGTGGYLKPILRLTWSIFSIGLFTETCLLRGGHPIQFALSWILSNTAGSIVGDFQYQNQFDDNVTMLDALFHSIKDSVQVLFGNQIGYKIRGAYYQPPPQQYQFQNPYFQHMH